MGSYTGHYKVYNIYKFIALFQAKFLVFLDWLNRMWKKFHFSKIPFYWQTSTEINMDK